MRDRLGVTAAGVVEPTGGKKAVQTHSRGHWWPLIVLCIAQLMIVLDTTIVNIALPTAERDLGFSEGARQWVITAYALAFGTLLLLGGKVADLLGRRRALIVGLVGFGAISAAAGAAPNIAVLIAARAGQGSFAALMAPAALSLLSSTYSAARERGVAFGVFGAIGGGGAAVGLLLGGVLTEYMSWRWTMYVNIAFAALAIVGTLLCFDRGTASRRQDRIDIPGAITISAGLFAVVFGMARAETDGWSDSITVTLLVVGAVLVLLFVLLQEHVASPLLPLRIFANRVRAGALLSLFMSAVGMFAMFLFVTFYLQETLNYSAVVSGLAFLPLTAGVVIAAGVGTQLLVARVPARVLLPIGLLLSGIALLLLTNLGTDTNYAVGLLPAMIIFGFGVGLVFGAGIALATLGVEDDDAGVASGLVNTVQQVGGSIGIAVLSTTATSSAASWIKTRLQVPPGSVAGREVVAAGTVHGYTTVYWCGAAVFAVGAILTALCLPRGVIIPDDAVAA